MNKTSIKVALLAVLVMAGMIVKGEAAVYTNPADELPFSLSLNTGNNFSQVYDVRLESRTGTNTYNRTYTNTTPVQTLLTEPLPGVAGKFTVFTETIKETYQYTYDYQNFDIKLDGYLETPQVGHVYRLTGEINTKPGASLLIDEDNLGFSLYMDNYFSNSAQALTASGIVTFKASNTLGQWDYELSKTFAGNPGSIYFSNSLDGHVNLNAPVYYEASYSVLGDTNIELSASYVSFALSSWYSSSSEEMLIGTDTKRNTLAEYDIPALPTPVPAAAWLLGSGLAGLIGLRRRKNNAA
jgi:hypothetical protein